MSAKIKFTEHLTTFYKYPSVCLFQDHVDDLDNLMSYLKVPSTRRRQQMIYIHIPFCHSMCFYCPFFKVNIHKVARETVDHVVDSIAKELKMYAETPFFQDVPIVNVHIGGGSPMTLEARHYEKLFNTIRAGYNMDACEVISIEGDPLSLQDEDKLKALIDMGMTRTSFGVQTFNEKTRRSLGVKTTVCDVYKAVETIKKCNINDFACDLLYNLPNQNVNEIRYNIDRACEMEPTGVDFYDLNLQPNSQLKKMIDKGFFKIKPSNKNEIEQLEAGLEAFEENNFKQIRSVVFQPIDKPEPNPRGVLNRFCSDIIAIGPSGRTTLYSGAANSRNYCSIEEYVSSLDNNQFPIEGGYIMSEEEIEERDMVMFPYYMKIAKDSINYTRFKDKIEEMKNSGYIEETKTHIQLTKLGRLWPGNVQYFFHSAPERERMANTFFSCMVDGRSIFNQDYMNCTKILATT